MSRDAGGHVLVIESDDFFSGGDLFLNMLSSFPDLLVFNHKLIVFRMTFVVARRGRRQMGWPYYHQKSAANMDFFRFHFLIIALIHLATHSLRPLHCTIHVSLTDL